MRAYLLLVISAIFLQSCLPKQSAVIPAKEDYFLQDFRKYTQRGFLFTPYEYEGEYESIGAIRIEVGPEMKLFRDKGQKGHGTYKIEKDVDPSEVIEKAYRLASGMGADALIDFIVTTEEEQFFGGSRKVYIISGFAIKRL